VWNGPSTSAQTDGAHARTHVFDTRKCKNMQLPGFRPLARLVITRSHCLLKNQLTAQPIRGQIQKQGSHMDTYTTSSTAAQETRLENRGSAATRPTHPPNAIQQHACTTTHHPRTAMPRTEQSETTTQASETERETRFGHLRRGRRRGSLYERKQSSSKHSLPVGTRHFRAPRRKHS